MWTRGDGERKCNRDKCMGRVRGMWKCVQCKIAKPKLDFSMWLAPRKSQQRQSIARCNACMKLQEEDAKAVAVRSTA